MIEQTAISPYTLGLMLAEFTLNSSTSFTAKTSAIAGVEEPVYQLQNIAAGVVLYRISGVGSALTRLGLRPIGESSKHIPEIFFDAEPENLALLMAGLVADPEAEGDLRLKFRSLRLGNDVVRLASAIGVEAINSLHQFEYICNRDLRYSPGISVVTIKGYRKI
jgi:hypothetical protein